MSHRTFVAIDFETAHHDRDSACAVGLVRVEGGRIVARERRLIQPPARPQWMFTSIHGIRREDVAHAPRFGQLWPTLQGLLDGAAGLVAHNASFDRGVLLASCRGAGLPAPTIAFHDSVRGARRAWSLPSVRLEAVCQHLGIPLEQHHDALCDAEAAARVWLAVVDVLGEEAWDLVTPAVRPARGRAGPVVAGVSALAAGQEDHLAAPRLRVLVTADWSTRDRARAVCAVDLARGRVERLEPPPAGWTLPAVLDAAEARRAGGSALVAVDAPLGIPASLARALPLDAQHFLEWLPRALGLVSFLQPVSDAGAWSPATPFFRVPAGRGALAAFVAAAAGHGVMLRRAVEVATHARSVFVHGIPGQVGPAARALWVDLVASRAAGKPFAVWPFEGPLRTLLDRPQCVLAEMYPRAAYGTALAATLPARPRALSKAKPDVRRRELDGLVGMPWLLQSGLVVPDSAWARARAGEDDFDALLSGLALARLVMAGAPLAQGSDARWEGGILGA